MGKTNCSSCKKKCSGEVLRVQEKYFHKDCFKCKVCGNSLAKGGFFSKNNDYYCTNDYQKTYGTKCANCNEYVEGEIISTMGKVFHQQCFTCHRCRQPFPSGDTVTYTGRDVFCQKCVQIPIRDSHTPFGDKLSTECAGCDEELREGQALIALDKQWHVWCFKCKTCSTVLHGEYMGKDGVPYCEKDYQKQFGVKCAYCSRFISGKVLQAGDNHHFHPTCARCSKCGDPFGDGEEMYLQGGAIWHPRCGPGPNQNGTVLNGTLPRVTSNGHGSEFDRASSSAISEMQLSMQSQSHSSSLMESLYKPSCSSVSLSKKNYFRATSPGLILREYNKSGNLAEDISRIYTYSYLTEKPAHGYLKKPIEPYDKPPTSPHFHRPTSANSIRSGLPVSKHNSKTGMKVLVDTICLETPRPKSPHMNNEEPIELAHYPGAKKPEANEESKIERDDFPAPPYPYTDPERRRHLSENFKAVTESSEGEDEVDELIVPLDEAEDQKLKKEEKELSKIATGIGKVFLKNVKEREKIRIWKAAHLDPRNASRTPAANKETPNRLRFECPIGASPSRNSDHSKPFEEEEYDRTYSRSSVGRSCSQIPTTYNVVTTLKSTSPKHGYGVMKPMQHATLPLSGRHGGGLSQYEFVDYSFSALGDKTHSTDFSSGKSDMSGSITDVERQITTVEMPASNTYTGGLGQYTNTCATLVRRSLPNMAHSALINEPAKIYPYHLLQITNYRLPSDVDRCNLERHLSDTEFDAIFQYSRPDFYQLPQWRRNELKRRARLF